MRNRDKCWQKDDFGYGREWEGGRRYFGDETGDYPGSCTRQGWGAGYDAIRTADRGRQDRERDDDQCRSDCYRRAERMKKFDVDCRT